MKKFGMWREILGVSPEYQLFEENLIRDSFRLWDSWWTTGIVVLIGVMGAHFRLMFLNAHTDCHCILGKDSRNLHPEMVFEFAVPSGCNDRHRLNSVAPWFPKKRTAFLSIIDDVQWTAPSEFWQRKALDEVDDKISNSSFYEKTQIRIFPGDAWKIVRTQIGAVDREKSLTHFSNNNNIRREVA